MATLYIDFENGNDNYGGTSFSLLASGTDGRITTSTFSSATASFPNDGSLINQYLSIFNGTIYAVYQITAWVSSTSLTIAALSGGTALANQAVDRQYYIGGRWNSLTSGATAVRIIPGDNIRAMASPDPTSLGVSGVWTGSVLQPTKAISSSTSGVPITIISNNHGYSNGDTLVVTGHTVNTNANGTWEIQNVTSSGFTLINSSGNGVGGATGTVRLRNNSVVKLASPLTQNIASFGNRGSVPSRTAWSTPDAVNITITQSTTDYKEGDVSDSIAIGAGFTTGRAAFKATSGVLDLSGYQQLSFFIKQTAGTVNVSGDASIRLCTDTSGTVPVHSGAIPALGALNVWQPITIDFGAPMNSGIQSVALYVDTDRAAVTFLLSNILACKAKSSNDSLSLISLIGKNSGTEPWIAIQSINDNRVFLDGPVSYLPTTTTLMGYNGTSETVLTYKRETIPIFTQQNLLEAGTVSNRFTLSGGWDRTNMSSQSGDSYLDGRRGNITIIQGNAQSYWTISKFSAYRAAIGFDNTTNTNNIIWTNIKDSNHHSQYGISIFSSNNITFSGINNLSFNVNAINHGSNCFNLNFLDIKNMRSNGGNVNIYNVGGSFYNCIVSGIQNISNNGGYGYDFTTWYYGIVRDITLINNNGTRGISLTNCSNTIVSNIGSISGTSATLAGVTYTNPILLSTCDNCRLINISGVLGATASAISCASSYNNEFTNVNTSGSTTSAFAADIGNSYCNKCTFGESTLVTGLTQYREGRVFLQNQNNNSNNHYIYMYGGTIVSSTSTRYSSSGISWALSPTNALRNISYPLQFSLAKVYVLANKLVTIRAMMSRTDVGLTVGLRVRGGQINGVSNDLTSYMITYVLPWEQVSLTFTPTENGVVEILGEAYGGTTYTGYIDNLTISQAT